MFYDSAPKLVAAVIILAIPAFLLFGLRVYVRLTSAKWGLDDWFMSAAMPFFLLLTISALLAADNGVGALDKNLTPASMILGLKWFYLAQLFFCISILFAKVSIALQLVRIASQKRAYLLGLYAIIGVIVVSLSFTTIYLLARCSPIKPIPLLWDVKMNTNTKISVVGLLGLGVFASVSAMIRLNYTVSYMNPEDNYLYGVVNLVIWAYAEIGIAVICGSTACLRPLFSSVFKFGSSSDHRDTFTLQSRKPRSRSYNGVKVPSVDSRTAKQGLVITECHGAGRAGSDADSASMKDNDSQVQIMEGTGIHVRYEVDQR
ncbi:hypothetical protein SLS56_004786 [Neofusicoccum ribis]|uniref:Rhodopsin domain-containing protein n=1 Tax=Neofusicoccum ribis TaxID=45134 RepID=A0ABR3SVB9_9PEZI